MNKQIKIAIFALILLTAVGFAAITITLNQTGTATINGIESNFIDNVTFDSVYFDDTSKTSGATLNVSPDRKSFTFTTQSLTALGESVTVNYNIKNDSQYGARIGELICTSEGEAKDYLTVQANNDYQDRIVKPSNTSCTDKILMYLNKSYPEDTGSTIKVTCSLQATATDYDPNDDTTQICDAN